LDSLSDIVDHRHYYFGASDCAYYLGEEGSRRYVSFLVGSAFLGVSVSVSLLLFWFGFFFFFFFRIGIGIGWRSFCFSLD
jgi:hypothetical protein